MAKGRNLVMLQGNVGNDPELRYTGGGTAVLNLRIATPDVRKVGDEFVEETEWHDVVFWGRLAEITNEYVKKGDKLDIAGKLRTRKYEDTDGNPRYKTEVVANEMIMLGGKEQDAPKTRSASKSVAPDDDLPF